MNDREQLHVSVPRALKDALDAECRERGTNKTVVLSEILAARYGIAYEPTPTEARRSTPHGGGPKS